jgi:Holliday junction DNA helicase RuvA
MIAQLTGRIVSSDEDSAVVDVGGVGYLVFCSARTLRALPGEGVTVTIFVETHVREDHIHLYGFTTATERAWFRTLLTVQGVGARMALAVLSTLPPEELSTAIAAEDKTALRRAPGVGPKVAGRIASELKDKAVGIALGPITVPRPSGAHAAPEETEDVSTGEAVSALVNLGYGRSEAFSAVATAARETGAAGDVAALIRAGLKELSAQ